MSRRTNERCRNKVGTRIRVGALVAALSLALQVQAQSITGGLYGSTSEAGAVVEVTRAATGFNRTVTVGENGQYSLQQLAPGQYQVRVLRDGNVLSSHAVTVVANSSAVVGAANSTELDTVVVRGNYYATVSNPIDVTTAELSTVLDASLIRDLPISQSSIYQLARLDSGSASGNSYQQIGGASETENRYYYNEFDTTYDVTGQGAIVFPQVAVASTQLMTGSAGVGWTSTTGSITSATLKQGSNDVHGGYSLYYTPPTNSVFRPKGENRLMDYNGRPSLMNAYNRSGHLANHYVWGSGPLVKDRLFAYVMLGSNFGNESTSYSTAWKTDYEAERREGLINLTWNITDNQSLNVAAYKTKDDSTTTLSANETSEWMPSKTTYGQATPTWLEQNTKLVVANYNWHINDDLRWRVMGGTMRFDYKETIETSGKPYITEWDYWYGVGKTYSAGHQWEPTDYYYEKDGVKTDLVWNVGNHEITIGGEYYRNNYYYEAKSNLAGYRGYDRNTWTWMGDRWYWGDAMWEYDYKQGGSFKSEQRGLYISDNWQVSDNVRVTLGGRWDQMENFTGGGEGFLDLSVFSPRVGLSWDVNGDSSLKIGANVGRYTLPIPSTLAYLVASQSTYYVNYYTVDGINADGTPVNPTLGYSYGYKDRQPALETIASRNLKNTIQDEFQVYVQQQLTPTWSFLGQASFHDLKRIVDQTCDMDGLIGDYVRANGHSRYAGLGGGTGCIEFNPGSSLVLRDDLDGNGVMQDITIPASALGFEKAKRRYLKLGAQLSHERTADEPYYLNLSYTWSHRYGNHDGYTNLTRSVNANPGISGNYAYWEATQGSNGDLSGDQRHSLLATGVYYFDSGLRVGAIGRYASARPLTCLGAMPGSQNTDLGNAGAVTHYCAGVLTARGSYKTDSTKQLDLSVGYDWNFGSEGAHKLSLDLQVQNVTNANAVTRRTMSSTTGLNAGGVTLNPAFNAVTGLQAPRSTNVYVRYSF